jgi:uncharacterized membrane protein
MDDRIRALETVQAVQEYKLDALTKAVEANTVAVLELTSLVAQSKGAWLAVGGISSVIAFLVSFFYGRH